ncbi:hypothetical protein [Piscinibacterium candidicorallinum]|uniref:Uncharacterized protein n=1 Tax=Piscinibacterium candidicorallinum TaxID=1793872 RepID=A0ABV7H768_9BURK
MHPLLGSLAFIDQQENPLSEALICARVRVCVEPDARSGLESRRLPNHRIPGRSTDYFIGMLEFVGPSFLAPGECADATARLLVLEQDANLFKQGFRWEIHLGAGNLIGWAEYVAPLSEDAA